MEFALGIFRVLTLRKKMPIKKDSQWLTGLKIRNSLATISKQEPVVQTVFQGEVYTKLSVSNTALSACTVFLLPQSTLSTNRTETFPTQLELHSYIPPKYLQPIRVARLQPVRTLLSGPIKLKIWSPHLPRIDQSGIGAGTGTCLYISQLPSGLGSSLSLYSKH